MPVRAIFNQPFDWQVAFFRNKLGNLIPTERWTDVWKSAHDTGFMVAGAAKADLLADLARAVDGAISEGKSIGWFRKNFDEIVAKHGWNYRGEYNWRTRVIYRTNMATSYAAGRLGQLREGNFQFWMYRHSDTVAHPRPLHLSWDGITLSPNDDWWKTHYPPNGWGCQCYVIGVSKRTADRMNGKFGPPPDNGLAPDGTPNGIDRGWDYQPGATVSDIIRKQLLGKLPDLPESLGKALQADLLLQREFDISNETGKWHEASFKDSPEWLKEAVRNAGTVNVQVRVGTTSYHQGNKIVMGHPVDTPIGSAVWRHEFGHHMDAKLRTNSFMRSTANDFTDAMNADSKTLKDFSGYGRSSKSASEILSKNRTAAADLPGKMVEFGSRAERETWLKSLADDTGLDFQDFRSWFSRVAAPGDLEIGDIQRDVWEARFLTAWKRRDALGLLDALEQVERNATGYKISGNGHRAYNKGLSGIISDLFSAATNKKIEGSGSHSAGYYKARSGWGRQAESWANITSIAGSGLTGLRLLETFTPEMFTVFRGAI